MSRGIKLQLNWFELGLENNLFLPTFLERKYSKGNSINKQFVLSSSHSSPWRKKNPIYFVDDASQNFLLCNIKSENIFYRVSHRYVDNFWLNFAILKTRYFKKVRPVLKIFQMAPWKFFHKVFKTGLTFWNVWF